MLSVLIPVYNQTVVKLVNDVRRQCERAGVPFQILVFDDKSDEKTRESNKSLSHEFGVNYVELSENIGRARIRNRLARMAQYENLIFMDGDSGIVKQDFIDHYIREARDQNVIYGGRVYQSGVPDDPKLILHWKYGRKREALPASKRVTDPYLNFQSNNFLIKSWVFKDHPFDEDIEGYGYEDLLFAYQLKEKGVTIRHVDNPVLHDGLESTEHLLSKTLTAVRNLAILNRQGKLSDVRLTKFYRKMEQYGSLKVLRNVYKIRSFAIEKNLRSNKPRIKNFSLWKLMKYDEQVRAIEANDGLV